MKRIISAMLAVIMCVLTLSGCEKVQGDGMSGEADDEALAAKGAELCKQIHGNAVWLQNSADIYDDKYDIVKYQNIEVNGAVILCNANTVFVYDAESGKLRYKAEIGSVMRAEAYAGKDGYDYRLLLNDGVVYRNTADESKVLQEALPLDMQFEPKKPNDEFFDCYDINERYFVWQDSDGIKLLDLAGGEPELIFSNSDLAENYKTIFKDTKSGEWSAYMGEMLYGCPRFICGGSKIAVTAFKESIIHNGISVYNLETKSVDFSHFIYEPYIPKYPFSDKYIIGGYERINAETGEVYASDEASKKMRSYWRTADGIYAIFDYGGVNGGDDPVDCHNLLIYLREIDDPEKYYRHIASLADPYAEAYFSVASTDYIVIILNGNLFAIKYSEY